MKEIQMRFPPEEGKKSEPAGGPTLKGKNKNVK